MSEARIKGVLSRWFSRSEIQRLGEAIGAYIPLYRHDIMVERLLSEAKARRRLREILQLMISELNRRRRVVGPASLEELDQDIRSLERILISLEGTTRLEEQKLVERITLIAYHYFGSELLELGRLLGIKEFLNIQSWYTLDREKELELLRLLVSRLSDEEFLDIFRRFPPKIRLRNFRGNFYVVKDGKISLGSAWDEVKKDVKELLNSQKPETAAKLYAFLKALCELCRNSRYYVLSDYYAPAPEEVLKRASEIYGSPFMPAPYHYMLLKQYGLFFRGGSRNYPTYCIPIEIIPAVMEALDEWIQKTKERPVTVRAERVSKKHKAMLMPRRELHEQLKELLTRLGRELDYEVKVEFEDPMGLYRYDVVWFRRPAVLPSKIFEIQVGGDVDRALARLKHALDVWGGAPDLFLVVAKEEDYTRVKRLVGNLLRGDIPRASW